MNPDDLLTAEAILILFIELARYLLVGLVALGGLLMLASAVVARFDERRA